MNKIQIKRCYPYWLPEFNDCFYKAYLYQVSNPSSDLITVKTINLYNCQIIDITPLGNLVNLKEAFLNHNLIDNLYPLRNLKIEHLFLHCNEIMDISPLKSMISLRHLKLDDNYISDISPLEKLINLKSLHLSSNYITDITPLKNLVNLEYLSLSNNPISQQQTEELQKALPNCEIYRQ